jgi:hypothetical protein
MSSRFAGAESFAGYPDAVEREPPQLLEELTRRREQSGALRIMEVKRQREAISTAPRAFSPARFQRSLQRSSRGRNGA